MTAQPADLGGASSGARGPGRHRRLLAVAALSSVALHLAGAAVLRWPAGTQGSGPERRAQVLTARLVDAPVAPQPVSVPVAFAPPMPVPVADTSQGQATVIASPLGRVADMPTPPAQATPAAQASSVPAMRTATATAAPAPSSGGTDADHGPRPLTDIVPEFPASAGTTGGSVTLRLVISDRGDVEKATVVGSTPPGVFDASALAAFSRARYAPGVRAGLPVRSEVVYQVDFAPLATGGDASGRTY